MFFFSKRYRELQISITPADDAYLARVTRSFVDGSNLADPLILADYRAGGSRGASRDIEAEAEASPAPPSYGEGLGQNLFKGNVGSDFERALGKEVPIRLRLELGSGANTSKDRFLQQLPWEQLIYKGQKIFLQPRFSILRKVSITEKQIRPVRGRLKILLLRSQPADREQLDVEDETKKIVKAMKKAGAIITVLPREKGGTINRQIYFEALERGQHILHFMGHGSGKGLHFVDETGTSQLVSAEQIGTDIKGLEDHQRPILAFLNACHSSSLEAAGTKLRGTAKQLFDAGIPVVVGMREAIGDLAAIAFSQAFYRKIAGGRSIDEAVSAGRLSIDQIKTESHQWHVPLLYSALEDMRVFRPFFLQRFRFAVFLLLMFVGVAWGLIIANRTPEVAVNPLVIETATMENQAVWQDGSLLRNTLGSAGFRILTGNPKAANFRIDQSLTVTANGLLFKRVVLNADGRQVQEPVVIHGPLTPDLQTIGLLKAESARKLLLILAPGKKAVVTNAKVLQAYYEGVNWSRRSLAEAQRSYRAALQLDPNHLPSKNNRAMLLLKTGDLQKALALMREVVAGNPRIAAYHYHLGLVLRVLGREEKAIAAFENALDQDSGYIDALHELGKLYLERDALRSARWRFEAVLKGSPNHAPAHKNLGRLYLKQELYQQAVEHLEDALAGFEREHHTDSAMHRAETGFLLARAYDRGGAPKKVHDLLERIDLSLLWRFGGEAAAFYAKFHHQEKEQNRATVLNIEGDDVVFPAHKRLLKLGDQIGPQQPIRIPQTAKVELLCRHRRLISLEGPVKWAPDHCQNFHGGLVPIELLDILLAPMVVGSDTGKLITSIKSRSLKNLDVISPLGRTAELRPNICWSVDTDSAGYLVSLSGDDDTFYSARINRDELKRAELNVAGQNHPMIQLSWPKRFPDLKREIHYRLTLRSDSGEEGFADLRLLDKTQATELKAKLSLLKSLDLPLRHRFEAQLFERYLCNGAALLAMGENLTIDPDLSLPFAHRCLEAGLYELAELGFQYEISKSENLRGRVSSLIGLGRLNASLKRMTVAENYLMTARSVLKDGNSDLIALVNNWLTRLNTRTPN